MIAEVGGEQLAALPLDAGRAIADPFRRTAELVGLLTERARQLAVPASTRTAGRWHQIRDMRRVAAAPRA